MESSSFSSSFFLPCGWPFVCLLVPFYFPPFSWRGMKIGIFCSMGNGLGLRDAYCYSEGFGFYNQHDAVY